MFSTVLKQFGTTKRQNLEANLNNKLSSLSSPLYFQVKSKAPSNACILELNFVRNLAWFQLGFKNFVHNLYVNNSID